MGLLRPLLKEVVIQYNQPVVYVVGRVGGEFTMDFLALLPVYPEVSYEVIVCF